MAETIIGVMGPGADASPDVVNLGRELGRLIAKNGWILLTGGRSAGVMDAASRGAKEAGGTTIAILPYKDFDSSRTSSWVDIPILTGMGEARNVINVLTSRVVLICGMGSGTASEAALALKAGRPVVLVAPDERALRFFTSLGDPVKIANDAGEAIELVKELLQ